MTRKFLSAIDLVTNRILNVGDPSGAQDAATKNYVDGSRPYVSVAQTSGGTGQSIANATDVAIAFETLVKNTGAGSWWSSGSNTLLVPPYTGGYRHVLMLGYPSSGVGTRRCLHINKGATIDFTHFLDGGCVPAANSEVGNTLHVTSVLQHTAGDQLLIAAWHDIGGTINLAKQFPSYPYASWTMIFMG